MNEMLHDIFIQEAEENLQILESLIISLEENPEDTSKINEAFRAIHSIKGGSGLAGFTGIKDFTHIVEDLFENIRNGTLSIKEELISVILESMDIIKLMISNIKENLDSNKGIKVDENIKKIKKYLNISDTNDQSKQDNPQEKKQSSRYFFGHLKYSKDIFLTGVDPLMFLSDLESIGQILSMELIDSALPDIKKFNGEEFYLQWKFFYESDKSEKEILDIFCFVIDESEIKIEVLDLENSSEKELSKYTVFNKGILNHVNTENVENRRSTERRAKERRGSGGQSETYIRVPTIKLEKIFNTVSELLISQARLNMLTDEYEDTIPDSFNLVTDSLKNITQMIQEQVTSLRMMNLTNSFDRFKRVIRDMAAESGKKVKLQISGHETELDKNMIEKLNDPLKHLVRNCIDHGIETSEERIQAGKSEEGHINLSASLQSGKVLIEISDDGRGINKEKLFNKALEKGLVSEDARLTDQEILNLIFNPGLSTAEKITDISGRGVGMDVVKNSINELHGEVEIFSEPEKGTKFRLHLPLTLAILDGMLISVGREKYIIPTLGILEIFRPESKQIKTVSGGEELVSFRGDFIPVIRLYKVFSVKTPIEDPEKAELIVINSGNKMFAILVDNVLEQYQIVLKSLQKNFRKVAHISSATILGDGGVALIIDTQSLVNVNAQVDDV